MCSLVGLFSVCKIRRAKCPFLVFRFWRSRFIDSFLYFISFTKWRRPRPRPSPPFGDGQRNEMLLELETLLTKWNSLTRYIRGAKVQNEEQKQPWISNLITQTRKVQGENRVHSTQDEEGGFVIVYTSIYVMLGIEFKELLDLYWFYEISREWAFPRRTHWHCSRPSVWSEAVQFSQQSPYLREEQYQRQCILFSTHCD